MYDSEKAKQLQKQSHVRGALSKQFFSNEQSELQKKRRQMKRILDQQVQQRKRVKQRQKQQLQRKHRKQQQQIRRYYEDVKQRQRRLSDNGSSFNGQKSNFNQSLMNNQNDSLVKKHYQQSLKQKVNSKTTLQQIDSGNIPLLPVMALSQGQINPNRLNHANQYSNSQHINAFHNNFDRQNAGNIPLLDLSDEPFMLKNKKKSKTQFKRQKTQRQNNHVHSNQIIISGNNNILGSNVKLHQSKNFHHQSLTNNMMFPQNSSVQSTKKKQRRRTLSDQEGNSGNSIVQQNIINSRVSKGSKFQQSIMNRSPSNTKRNTQMQIPQQIQQMQNQNKMLKTQLKKSQQAISLLIGAVRSNPKLDKFRVQAQKILHNAQNYPKASQNQQNKIVQKKQQSPLLLPKLKIKHQSIMHDYLLQAAKKARLKNLKSQASKY